MKRQFKFRAWQVKSKKFLHEEIVNNTTSVPVLSEGNAFALNQEHVVFQQFTGLKDKEGREIFEGDWLKDDVGVLYQVKFGPLPLDKSGDCVCTFPAFYAEGRDSSASHECNTIGEWMIVIGNIFENPELLVKEKVELSKTTAADQ